MPQICFDDQAGLDAALALLRDGDIVAVPTETVYGLAADATDADAVARIYAAKGRPAFNPLIAHVSGHEMAATHARIPPRADRLMAAFWPGPLTLVLPARRDGGIADTVRAGLATIALRSPAHPFMQRLIAALGRPLAAPSANPSGRISPTTAAHVAAGLGDAVPLIIDGGAANRGVESTIVAVEDDRLRLLRPGSITREDLMAFGPVDLARTSDPVTAPGMTDAHYAPAKPLRLDAVTANADEFHIGFGAIAGDLNLSAAADPAEAASALFAALHVADASPAAAIAVAPVPAIGIGAAINDRLRRAAN